MRYRLLGLLLVAPLLSGCDKTPNTFTVIDPKGTADRAEVHLCGARTTLWHINRRFIGIHFTDCEGDGRVLVHLSDGRTASCLIGYVTSGLNQDFRFAIDDGKCLPAGR